MGAHIAPPMSEPRMIVQLNCSGPISTMKVIASVTVTKNSAKLADSIALLGSTLFVTRVVVVIGPHPSPPKASRSAREKSYK